METTSNIAQRLEALEALIAPLQVENALLRARVMKLEAGHKLPKLKPGQLFVNAYTTFISTDLFLSENSIHTSNF